MNQLDERELFAFLDSLQISHTTHRHAPVFTVEESSHLYDNIPGGHFKTLLVRDKKGTMALVVMEGSLRVDLKKVAAVLGCGRLSFASPERLFETLGLRPGAVTPFGLINRRRGDAEGDTLTVLLDESLMTHKQVNFHPLHNGATTTICRKDLFHFIEACGYDPKITNVQAGAA